MLADREVSRREQLEDVPLSVSVITGDELERELSVDLNSMTRRSASIQLNQNNSRGASLSIRGLGKRAFTETQDPSVGLTVDGVSYGLTQLGNFDFFDIDTVEVRRGRQGTLGGKDASVGSVHILTHRPSFERSADFSLTAGQRDALFAKATSAVRSSMTSSPGAPRSCPIAAAASMRVPTIQTTASTRRTVSADACNCSSRRQRMGSPCA